MSKNGIQQDFLLKHEYGMHARPAAMLVKTACRFDAEVRMSHKGRVVDAKSIMGVLSLGVVCGDRFRIEICGADEHDAMTAIADLFERGLLEINELPSLPVEDHHDRVMLAREAAGAL